MSHRPAHDSAYSLASSLTSRVLNGLAGLTFAVGAFAAPPSDVLEARSALNLTLRAPLTRLFTALDQKQPKDRWDFLALTQEERDAIEDGTFVEGELYLSVDGETRKLGVTVYSRGNTSAHHSECPFRKLKLKFKQGDTAGTPFEGHKSIRLATHCGEASDSAKDMTFFSRLANEHSPVREALAYQIADTVGVPTFRTRPAVITYLDTTQPGIAPRQRNAFLIETKDHLVKRLKLTNLIDEDLTQPDETPKPNTFTMEWADHLALADVARVYVFETLIANNDYMLPQNSSDWSFKFEEGQGGNWNIKLGVTDARVFPIAYDFDIAGIVNGFGNGLAWAGYNPAFFGPDEAAWSFTEKNMFASLQHLRTALPREVFAQTLAHFKSRKSALYALVEGHPFRKDPNGKQLALRHLNAFYRILGRPLDLPVVVGGPTIYTKPDSHAVCEPENFGPRSSNAVSNGTLARAVLDGHGQPVVQGQWVKVRLLDVNRRAQECAAHDVWLSHDPKVETSAWSIQTQWPAKP